MSTLYIRLPSHAAAGSAAGLIAMPCPFALALHNAAIAHQGVMPLQGLSGSFANAQRTVVLLAASDVTLLRMKVPKLSGARLKAALPNLVEDQLIGDPSDCAVIAGEESAGLRTIAVAQRAWLETVASTLTSLGARQITLLPAQLCLPGKADSLGAAICEYGNTIDVTLRLSEHDGIGFALSTDANEPVAHKVIQALCVVAPKASVALHVPQSAVPAFQAAANEGGKFDQPVSVLADNWPYWISGASSAKPDLMAGLGAGTSRKPDLRAWRWPLALAAAVLAINIIALNIDWWRMKDEANSLRASMMHIYKSVFPKETVIIDPVAQMQQKITAARHGAGFAAPDDFTALTAAFGEAWASVAAASGKSPTIAALEYRERSLLVRLKPLPDSARDGEALMQPMKTALAERNVSLEQVPSESAVAWKIRSAK